MEKLRITLKKRIDELWAAADNTVGTLHLWIVAALALGGVAAAPFGAWLVRFIQPTLLMRVVGVLVIALSLRTLYLALA